MLEVHDSLSAVMMVLAEKVRRRLSTARCRHRWLHEPMQKTGANSRWSGACALEWSQGAERALSDKQQERRNLLNHPPIPPGGWCRGISIAPARQMPVSVTE